MNKAVVKGLTGLVMVGILSGCHEDSSHSGAGVTAVLHPELELEAVRTDGDCKEVFGGQICAWSESKGKDLLSFGVTVPMVTVENAPPEGDMVFPPITWARVAMTDQVKEITGFDHLGVNWEIFGHPPKTFMTPHFDFHFYSMTGDDVDAIDCSDLTKPESLPEGYVLPDQYIEEMNVMLVGLCVPEMGMHAVNAAESASEEFFDVSMIVGYIYGKVHFIEPMIAKHHLMRRADFTVAVPDMGVRGDALVNPVAFNALYDANRDAYELRFTLAAD